MRVRSFVSLALLSSATLIAQQTFFPKGAFDANPRTDKFLSEWYSAEVVALKEPSLLTRSPSTSSESYRFLWLRSFHHPISIRLDVREDGTGTLTTKVAEGAAGYPDTSKGKPLIQDESRSISAEQTQAFLKLVNQVEFWSVPAYQDGDQTGTDGSEWIVEGTKAGHYHVIARWDSDDKPYKPSKEAARRLGRALAFDLAQLKIPEKEIY